MNPKTIGWLFVAAQAILLGSLVLLPGRDDWATPAWLRTIGYVLIVAGLAAVALAALRLGPALTPTPVPTEKGRLATGGLYQYVRHPIYTGVLVLVAGLATRSGSFVNLAIAVATVLFFNSKAKWEEAQLASRYDNYLDYAAATPRFIPQPWLRRRVR